MALLLISTPHQAIAQPEIDQPALRLTHGTLLEFADFQFVKPSPKPDYDKDVLEPLRAAQAAAAKAEADRLAKLKSDCEARGGHLDGEQCITPPPPKPKPVVASTSVTVRSYTAYGNNYDWGNCTWYVASRVSVPSGMGNATNWSYGLSAAGWVRSLQVGSVGVSHVGWAGHVVYVEAVTAAGVLISEANYHGLGVVDTRLVSAGEYEWFHR